MVAELEKSQPNSRDFAGALNNLAQLHGEVGRDGEAEPMYKHAIAIMERARGPSHPDVGKLLNNLTTLNGREDRHADAEPLAVCAGREGELPRRDHARRF